MKLERDENGAIVLRLDFPADLYHAEQVIDEANGSYTTWIYLHDDKVAEKICEELNQELIATELQKIVRGTE